MISILFKLLCTLVLFIAILIVLVGAIWVLSLMLKEALEVDVLWNAKRKLRSYIYGERKVMERGLKRRAIRGDENRKKTIGIKREIFKRKNHKKSVQVQSDNVVKKGGRGGKQV